MNAFYLFIRRLHLNLRHNFYSEISIKFLFSSDLLSIWSFISIHKISFNTFPFSNSYFTINFNRKSLCTKKERKKALLLFVNNTANRMLLTFSPLVVVLVLFNFFLSFLWYFFLPCYLLSHSFASNDRMWSSFCCWPIMLLLCIKSKEYEIWCWCLGKKQHTPQKQNKKKRRVVFRCFLTFIEIYSICFAVQFLGRLTTNIDNELTNHKIQFVFSSAFFSAFFFSLLLLSLD